MCTLTSDCPGIRPYSASAKCITKPKFQKDEGLAKILQRYPSVFNGLGKLKDHQVKLNIDTNVPPVFQPQRRIPFHMRQKVQVAIKELESQGIIEMVPDSQPTPWFSAVVAVPKKDGNFRTCVDMRAANTAIKRVRHLIPPVADISLELSGAKFFSKLELHPESQVPLVLISDCTSIRV